MKIEFQYSKIYDLVFHFLAHMKVENASDLYSPNYIETIASIKSRNKSDILQEASRLTAYYNENFERVGLINFFPFYCKDLPSLKDLLRNSDAFCQEDQEQFILPFLNCLEREYVFYSDYWEQVYLAHMDSRSSVESYILQALAKYDRLWDYCKKEAAVVAFSFSLTRNGRGLGNDNAFTAIVPYPSSEDVYADSFFTLLHEYTHQITDARLLTNIYMKDGSHALSENAAILFDYYILKAIREPDVPSYFAWLSRMAGEEEHRLTEAEFLSIFPIPDSLNDALASLVQAIIEG